MNPQIKTVAKFTFINHIKTKSFWFMVISPILFALIGFGVTYIAFNSANNETPTVAVIGTDATRSAINDDKSDLNIHVSKITDENEATKALKDGDIDAVLTVNDQQANLTTQPKSQKVDKTELQGFLQKLTFADRAKQYGLTDQQTSSLSKQFPLNTTVINDGKKESGDTADSFNTGISTAITFIVFLVIMTYAQILATEIANEKSSRIMETLLAASSAKAQFYGKLIGVALLPLVQFALYGLGFAGIYLYFKDQSFMKDFVANIPHINPWALVYTLVFIIVGVSLYLILAAITASLVNDSSQTQQAIQPTMLLSLVPYIIGYTSIFSGSGGIMTKVFSYVPFASQTLMPGQLIAQKTEWPLALLSLAIAVIFLVFFARFGEKLYARNVLSYSDENIMKQLMRQLRRQA
ncbi:ABC transporter permease [Lactobacillaceae bacterium L1_55_11]|nr:ABC transporter permease [Lactobacillaceae bacterium L1_55_11]